MEEQILFRLRVSFMRFISLLKMVFITKLSRTAFNHIKEWNSTHERPTCISSLRIRDITICEIHYLTPIHAVNTRRLGQSNVHHNEQHVSLVNYYQHARICLNSMILPYRQLAMDKFRINKSFMDLNMQKWNTIDMNENDYNHYINSLQI